jgi:hypothetical protein
MMSKNVKTVLDRVLTWPPERQEDVARVLIGMESQDKSELHLTKDQVAEVRRRIARTDRRTIPFEDAFKRFRYRKA